MTRFIKKQAKSWSYSSLSQWMKCSASYYYGRLLKLPTPKVPAMERGTTIHKRGELFLLGEIKELPDEYASFGKEMRGLRKLGAVPEKDWCVTREWKACGPTDWDVVWGRCKTDAHIPPDKNGELVTIDFKTGGVYPEHRMQAEVSSTFALAYYEFKTIHVEFWYLDKNHVEPFDYTIDEVNKLKKKYLKKLEAYFADRTFEATPGFHCNRCPFRSSKQLANGEMGPCEAWKK